VFVCVCVVREEVASFTTPVLVNMWFSQAKDNFGMEHMSTVIEVADFPGIEQMSRSRAMPR
jgi:predicted Na+-dependent transporter